jgi:autotransporter-associated beta strand protein
MNTHVENNTLCSLVTTICEPFHASTKTFLTLVLLAALFCVGSAQAADVTAAWNVNADGNWSLGSNWSGGIAATGTTGVAYFTNTITASRTVNLDSKPWTINGLTFTNTGANGWVITNGTLNLAGTKPSITVYTNSTVTIQSTISGSVGLQKNGPGQLILSGSNTFTSTVEIPSGELKLNSATALNQTPGSEIYVNLNNTGGVAPTLTLNGNSITVSSLRGPKSNAAIQNANTTPVTLTVGNTNNLISNLWDGTIRDGAGGGALTVVKMGTGLLNLGAGGNDFSGGLFIKAGTVQSGTTPSFGIAGVTLGDSTVGQDAVMQLRGNSPNVTNSIIIASGVGTRTILGIYNATLLTTVSGPITMNTNLTLQITTATTSPTLIFSGGFVGTGSLTLRADNTTAGGIILSNASVNMTGQIINSGTGTVGFADTIIKAVIGPNVTGILQNSTNSILKLSGANTAYAGTTMVSKGTLEITTNTCLGGTSSVVIADGGAKMKLNFIGTNTIKTLYFGDKLQYRGTWGSNASTADHKSNTYFESANTGVLKVTNGPVNGTMIRVF